MAKMTVKEHDIINFSMNADVGAHRYYDKEVLCKDGNLVVNLDGNDIPLDKVYHIEVVGTACIYIEPPSEEKGMSEREKIIKGLQCCTHDGCKGCPFRRYKCTCQTDLMFSALEYIKRKAPPIIQQKTARGFNTVDLTDKYGAPFYVRQSSVNMSEVWIGIKAMSEPNDRHYQGNIVGDQIYAILVDNKTWKAIKKARKMCKK